MCHDLKPTGEHDMKMGKEKHKNQLKEVNFVGTPETMKKKKMATVGMYANKKDILKY